MKKIKLFCVSLGCDKNLVDTEKMLGVAGGLGVTFTDDETEADAVLINTCCFINDAKEESVNTIRRNFRNHLLRRDRTGSDGAFWRR